MKKTVSLFLIIIMAFLALSSCKQQTTPSESVTVPSESAPTESVPSSDLPTDEPVHSEEPTAAPTKTTSGTNIGEPTDKAVSGYSLAKNGYNGINFIETPSKIIFLNNPVNPNTKAYTHYYSKVDGEFYPLCFDPLCQHKDIWDGEKYVGTTCVAKMLYWNNYSRDNTFTPPLYCNGRIYFVYFDEIWSCNEYASDLRIDVSFSKLPSDFTKTEARKRKTNQIFNFDRFICSGDSIYFKHIDADGGVRYYRLDTKTNKLHNLTKGAEELAVKLGVDSLYFDYAVANYISFAGTDPDTHTLKHITTDQNLNPSNIPFLGKHDAISILRNTANGQLCGIRRFDEEGKTVVSVDILEILPNGECRKIDAGTGGMYIAEKYTYGKGGVSVMLGKEITLTGFERDIVNQNNGICRYDKKTGEKETLFQDDWLQLNYIYCVNEETGDFFANMMKYEKLENGNVKSSTNYLYTGKIVDGKLENFEPAQIDEPSGIEPPFIIPGWD